MAKTKIVPGQLSLFDVYINQIETIKEENEIENNILQEALNVRPSNSSTRHSKKNPQQRDNSQDSVSGTTKFSLFDIGQVGTEQSRETIGVGSSWNNNDFPLFGKTNNDGGRSSTIGSSGHDVSPRNEYLGDFSDFGSEYRATNYRITPQDRLGVGGAKSKYADNIDAIKLLQDLRQQGSIFATEREQEILVKYVGWGGLSGVFDKDHPTWNKEYEELKGLLSSSDYANARSSTQDAHFTSETIIKCMYEGLSRLGVGNSSTSLDVLEPSAGIGNFIGLKPENLDMNFYAIERDPITADILKFLYPEEHHFPIAFQDSAIKSSLFDVTIGNPPFGQQKVFDKNFPELSSFSIHNYFIAKSLNLVKEGGIGAFVVSRYFLDSVDSTHRKAIAQNAQFLGAIRLPSTAFKQNALTDVTTDIVFFQKQTKQDNSLDWIKSNERTFTDIKSGETKYGYINQYFHDFPEQITGNMMFSSGMFHDDLKCFELPDTDLSKLISTCIKKLPENIFKINEESVIKQKTFIPNETFLKSEYFESLKMDSFCHIPGQDKIFIKTTDDFGYNTYLPISVKNDTARSRIIGMIQIRDTLRSLMNTEKANGDAEEMVRKRRLLNTQYDSFKKKYGYLNSQTNRLLMRTDPESSLIQSLELNYDKGISKEQAQKLRREFRPPNAQKATIFEKRVLESAQPVLIADPVYDALSISLRETGTINFSRMSSLLSQPVDAIKLELQQKNLIFENPETETWEIKDKYLTGNVKHKLEIAKTALERDSKYQVNVDALTTVMPKDIEPVDIGIKFGSTWIPAEDILLFINEKIGGLSLNHHLEYIPLLGRWEAKLAIKDNSINDEIWGIPEYPADKLISSLLMNKSIKVEKESGQRDDNGKPIMVVDQELTAVAMQKANEIQQNFSDWIWDDDERRSRLSTLYNEIFNTHVVPNYDGSHLLLSGASSNVNLRPHQKDAVWRAIQEGTTLFDHVVGAGKTLVAVATIKESKRMGFLNKPMIVVPNHLVYQWRDEFYKLYPDANILVADKIDFLKENRERFFSRVATGNWDAVVVAHSSFKKIEMPRNLQEEILGEQIDAVIHALEIGRKNEGSRATIKQLEKQRDRMQERYKKLIDSGGEKDKSVDFADLGVDALFVDEAHEFKNLSYTTSMNVSGLGNITGSAKALDLFVKCRYLQKQNNGKGVYFLTGTPISNTIAEVFTLQRYMQLDELKSKNIEHFDAWASNFGKITNNWELDATGVNYKLKSRFAQFENVPELLSMYRTFADVVTKADLDEQAQMAGLPPVTPPIMGGKPYNHVVERSPEQAVYMDKIIHRMEHLPKDPRIDNPLKITNDARKAGLDYRLINPDADDYRDSKTNMAAERIYQIWQNTTADKGTQLVFCDLSTPKKSITFSEPEVTFIGDDIKKKEDEDIEADISPLDMDYILANSSANSKFSVYNDLKQKLITKGIPQGEIVFIHDANTDQRKDKLFKDVRQGSVRVLIGSTQKMGAGMNVQERLVAAHHLDAPWRPSDLEQRNGRIIRQGNKLYEKAPESFQVGIYYYATKQTYDARMWQTIEYKAAAIEQFRKGDVLQRTIDDVQSEAATAAEMKAAASGNPLILMQVSLDSELRKLEALFSQHNRSKHRLVSRLKYLNNAELRFADAKKEYDESVKLRDENTRIIIDKEGKSKIKLEIFANGKILTVDNADELSQKVLSGADEVLDNRRKEISLGRYRGFEIIIKHAVVASKNGFLFALRPNHRKEYHPNNLVYKADENFNISGLFQRIDNYLGKGFDERFESAKKSYQNEILELPNAEMALDKGFAQQAELSLARDNHNAVIRELQRIQAEPEYVSEWKPKSLEDVQNKQIQVVPGTEKIEVTTEHFEEVQDNGVQAIPAPASVSEKIETKLVNKVLSLEEKVVGINIKKFRFFH